MSYSSSNYRDLGAEHEMQIIRGDFYSLKIIPLLAVLFCVILFVFGYFDILENKAFLDTINSSLEKYPNSSSLIESRNLIYSEAFKYVIYVGLPILCIAVIVYYCFGKSEIIVTERCIYGKGLFGLQADILWSEIVAVSTSSLLGGVYIHTNGNKTVRFMALRNRTNMYNYINKIHRERQEVNLNPGYETKHQETAPVTRNETEQQNRTAAKDDFDKLRQYKKLLDDGIITEEEFNAKKKQILGV